MKKLIFTIILFSLSCAHQPTLDPNAVVCRSASYEQGPVKFLGCNRKAADTCKEKTGAECSVVLYNSAQNHILEASSLADRKLYLSATLAYMQALSKLTQANIILGEAKLDNFTDWQVAVAMGLEVKIKKGIDVCERRIRRLGQLRR